MHKKNCYYSVNFYPIWTKICPRNPLHMPSIFHVRYTVPPMPLERDIAKFIKNGSIFYLIFRVYLVSQWNLGKMTSYTFHMLANWGPHANFQEFLTAHLRDRLLRYLFLYHSKGTKSAQDPTRASMVKVRQKTRPPRKNWAPCGANGHTSSKGMPRHAHGRWALMRVCGVDVTEVTLSWWCVRWLVGKVWSERERN